MDFASALQFNTKGYCINEGLPEDHWASLLQFMFRPTKVETEISPVYNETPVLGMSHPTPSYSHTGAQIVTFDLYWNTLMGMKEKGRFTAGSGSTGGLGSYVNAQMAESNSGEKSLARWAEKIEGGRRFLEALTIPPEAEPGIIGGVSPATALLVLPGICALRVRLWSLRFLFEDHDQQGNLRALVASTTWRECPRTRFTMEEVLDTGSFRA